MAISTLSKFTVPLANDQSSASQGLLMPKLQYRFRAILENFGVSTPRSELTKQVMDITRPNLSFDQVTLDVYNSRVYIAGKHTWEAITITLRDDVNNSVTKLVGEQIQKQLFNGRRPIRQTPSDHPWLTATALAVEHHACPSRTKHLWRTFEPGQDLAT